MIVYRVGRTKYARDVTGEGARLFGGRWNHKGTACLYTAESRALAVLEYTVNVNLDDIPRALSITTFKLPDDSVQLLTESDLPGSWLGIPSAAATRDYGTRLLKNVTALVTRIPSTIIPEEWNYLINPAHPAIGGCKVLDCKDFVYDLRIKTV
jgi:RES domain-containing protein